MLWSYLQVRVTLRDKKVAKGCFFLLSFKLYFFQPTTFSSFFEMLSCHLITCLLLSPLCQIFCLHQSKCKEEKTRDIAYLAWNFLPSVNLNVKILINKFCKLYKFVIYIKFVFILIHLVNLDRETWFRTSCPAWRLRSANSDMSVQSTADRFDLQIQIQIQIQNLNFKSCQDIRKKDMKEFWHGSTIFNRRLWLPKTAV